MTKHTLIFLLLGMILASCSKDDQCKICTYEEKLIDEDGNTAGIYSSEKEYCDEKLDEFLERDTLYTITSSEHIITDHQGTIEVRNYCGK